MHCVEPGADVLNSFHFRNQRWNAHELPLNSNSIKAEIYTNHIALYYNTTVNQILPLIT
jgi:hypothetical protein